MIRLMKQKDIETLPTSDLRPC